MVLGGTGIVLGFTSWVWSLARSESCADLPREDLTLFEMGQLRRTIDRYKSDPSKPMALTPRQASFVLREEFKLLAWFTVAGDLVLLEARQPYEGGCFDLAFRGRLDVRDGVAYAVPTDLSIGRLGLDWLPRQTWEIRPETLQDAGVDGGAELLAHLDSVTVADGWFFVSIDDPSWIR